MVAGIVLQDRKMLAASNSSKGLLLKLLYDLHGVLAIPSTPYVPHHSQRDREEHSHSNGRTLGAPLSPRSSASRVR